MIEMLRPPRLDPLPYDVQREVPFYRTCVAFRNAVEVMVIRRRQALGTHDPVAPDDFMFWGLARSSLIRFYLLEGDEGQSSEAQLWDDDDGGGVAGSRVPRRPPGDAGAAGAEAIPADDEAESVFAVGARTAPGTKPSESPYEGL